MSAPELIYTDTLNGHTYKRAMWWVVELINLHPLMDPFYRKVGGPYGQESEARKKHPELECPECEGTNLNEAKTVCFDCSASDYSVV